jgi:Holliday junction resolvase
VPNSRYVSGANFERAVKAHLESCGWFVVRSAGSHGPVDLVALWHDFTPALIQCKTNGKVSPNDRAALRQLELKTGAIPIIASRPKRGMMKFSTLGGFPWTP